MQLELIIAALRERCASFGGRVAGSAQFKMLQENQALTVPAAFVVPLDDNPEKSSSQNGVRQSLTDSFAVVVAISNTADERGQAAAHTADSMRAELWAALLGWRPAEQYDGLAYEGGSVLAIDRARLWCQFEFGADMEIDGSDGYQDTELAGLPHFDGVNFKADYLDPADPNIGSPDGRIEVEYSAPQAGNLP